MIAFVRGTVAQVGLTSVVLDVGSVGVEVHCAPNTIAGLSTGSPAQLATSLVVREDSMTVFGFPDEEEKQLFELVQTASGVGPKLAQAMLAVLSPDDLRRAVGSEDVRALTRVPGIGQKGAQRIILELKDRIGAVATGTGLPQQSAAPVDAEPAWRTQVRAGLTGLGWSDKEAQRALDLVAQDAGPAPDVGALLREALRSLSRA